MAVDLVTAAQQVIAGLGRVGAALGPDGNVDAAVAEVARLTYDTAEIRTAVGRMPPVDLASAVGPGETSPVLKWLRPVVELRGPAGVLKIAPYGEPAEGGEWVLWAAPAGAALVLIGVGVAVGYALACDSR